MDLINALIWLFVVMLMGYSLLELAAWRTQVLTALEKAALSFPIGLAVMSSYFGLAALLGASFNIINIWIMAAGLGLIAWLARKANAISPRQDGNVQEKVNLAALDYFFIAAMMAQVLYNFFKSVIKSWSNYDFLLQYGLKAKVFYLAGGIPPGFLETFQGISPNLQYPPMMTFSVVSFYMFQGYLNDILVNIIGPLFFVSLLVFFYAVLRRFTNIRSALVFTFLLATVKQFADYGSFANSDIILSFYFSASAFFLYLWFVNKRPAYFRLSLVLSACMMYIKTEGGLLLAVNAAVIILYVLMFERSKFNKALLYIAVAAVLIGTYVTITRSLQLSVHDRFEHFSLAQAPARLIKNIDRIPTILYHYQKTLFGIKKWNILWVLFLLTLVCHVKKIFAKEYLLISAWLFFIVIGYTCIYLLTELDVDWQISMTLGRFFLHNVPLAVFYMALMWKDETSGIFNRNNREDI